MPLHGPVVSLGAKIVDAVMKPQQILGFSPEELASVGLADGLTNNEIAEVKREMWRTRDFNFPSFQINQGDQQAQKCVFDELKKDHQSCVKGKTCARIQNNAPKFKESIGDCHSKGI